MARTVYYDYQGREIDPPETVSIFVDNEKKGEYVFRIKGKWIGNYCPYRCDQCGHYADSKQNFCSYCGSDMREEKWINS